MSEEGKATDGGQDAAVPADQGAARTAGDRGEARPAPPAARGAAGSVQGAAASHELASAALEPPPAAPTAPEAPSPAAPHVPPSAEATDGMEEPRAGGETAVSKSVEPVETAEPVEEAEAGARLEAQPAPQPEAVPPEGPAASGDLDELILPSSLQAPPPLDAGTVVGPAGGLRIVRHVEARGRMNRYDAIWRDQAGHGVEVEVREAPVDHAPLEREAAVLTSVRFRMLPQTFAAFEHEGRRYLVVERTEGRTLEAALRAGLGAEEAISVVLQLVQVLRRLHQEGWAVVGLAPAAVRLGQPIRLTEVHSAVRLGKAPPHALHVAGYSAPELAHPATITGKEEVYTLAAILLWALSGQLPTEAGPELGSLPFSVRLPGGPQLLASALSPVEDRIDLEAFYRRLLELKERLSQVALALEVASATTVGLNPTRLVNEDSCGYVTWSVGAAEGLSYRALLCVADGMGGMEAGEVASRTALRTVLSAATVPAPPAPPSDGTSGGEPARVDPPLDLVALVQRAAAAVHEAAQGRQMGTTVTCVEVRDGELTLAHVGDTRAYLLRAGDLTQLTADHSLVAAMVASGVLSSEEARGHPDSNKVLRSLGSQRELPERYVDTLEAAFGQPALQLQPGDRLLLCSDGIWGSVPDDRIAEVLRQAPDCPEAAGALVELALQAGAPDNAAAVVARCVRAPSW